MTAIGACPQGKIWVHVGDRGADFYPFLVACRKQKCQFLIRCYTNRKMQAPDGSVQYLMEFARQMPAQEGRVLHLSAGHGHPARDARVRIAFSPLEVLPHWSDRKGPMLSCWIIRVWEVDPDPTVAEPVDWYLLTSLPVETLEQAWERVDWHGD